VPIVVTSYTEVELPLDLERMRDLQEVEIELKPQRNPFASLRPERNFVSDDVAPLIYKNYYVGVARGRPRSR
jgi:splicing suppressor protein 51